MSVHYEVEARHGPGRPWWPVLTDDLEIIRHNTVEDAEGFISVHSPNLETRIIKVSREEVTNDD